MAKFDVLGLGNPLIDVFYNVEDSFLEELKLSKGSMNLVDVDRQNEILKKGANSKKSTSLGGSCANTMAIVSQLGGKSAYGGKLGKDELGEDYENQLVNLGVTSFLKKQEGATGSTVILVTPDAERTMNTHLGMCVNFSDSDVDRQGIENTKYLYVEGYLWDTPIQKKAVSAALEMAKSAGCIISLSLSDSYCVDRHKKDFQSMLDNYVDLVFCNESEAEIMTGQSDAEKQIEVLSKSTKEIVLTLGKKGSKIYANNTVTDIDCFPANAIDTTGAGDSFAAGYLYGITHNYTTEQAGKLASRCAAEIVSQMGPRYNGDFRALVSDYLID